MPTLLRDFTGLQYQLTNKISKAYMATMHLSLLNIPSILAASRRMCSSHLDESDRAVQGASVS